MERKDLSLKCSNKPIKKCHSDTGKSKAEFSIVIKPNFMFAYNIRDHTTYTDSELVGRLVEKIRDAGFRNIAVVEAQSSYGEYFEKRSVREMAEYLKYDGTPGYKVVDMTEDATENRYLGTHLGYHPVSTAWRDADFRISFAKNKTHAYAYYTLTVRVFSKPQIKLIGNGSMYRPWLNVPVALTLFTHKGLDANYHFGNLLYNSCAQMDKNHFELKRHAIYIKLLRWLSLPVCRAFFRFTNEKPMWYNRMVSRAHNWLGY